jgi:hypothetical protein
MKINNFSTRYPSVSGVIFDPVYNSKPALHISALAELEPVSESQLCRVYAFLVTTGAQ